MSRVPNRLSSPVRPTTVASTRMSRTPSTRSWRKCRHSASSMPRPRCPSRISTRQFRRQVTQAFDKENPPAQVAAEEDLLKRLGLLPQDADLRSMMLDLYESQVAAFYDPKTGAMTIVKRDGTFGPEERVFVAHEYDHALQDQHWDLQKVTQVPATQGDRALAHLALVEGDATSLMLQWASQNLTADELSQVSSAMTPAEQEVLDGMPEIFVARWSSPTWRARCSSRRSWDRVAGAASMPHGMSCRLRPNRSCTPSVTRQTHRSR